MENLIPTVKLNLEDKEYTLALDLNALCKYEEVSGKSSFSFGEGMNAKDLRALLWASMLREQPESKLEDVGKLLHMGNIAEISELLGGLFEESSPDEESEGNAKSPNG